MYHIPKVNFAHIDFADGSYVNLASQGRIDKTGVIVGFHHTNAEYAKNYNLTVQSLLSGYDTYRDGIIAITDGHKIVASNDESMVGKNVKENEVVRKLRNNGKIGKLVRVQNKFEGYYGSMDKSRDYYIYVYLPESTVFEIVPRNILYALAIYITLLIIIQLIKQSSERKYLVEQNKREKEYKEKLMESAKKAEQANTAKTEFLQRMSHDIRTPINGIRGMIELSEFNPSLLHSSSTLPFSSITIIPVRRCSDAYFFNASTSSSEPQNSISRFTCCVFTITLISVFVSVASLYFSYIEH